LSQLSNVSGWMQEVHLTKQLFPSFKHPMWLHFAMLKLKSFILLQKHWWKVKPCLLDCAKIVLLLRPKHVTNWNWRIIYAALSTINQRVEMLMKRKDSQKSY